MWKLPLYMAVGEEGVDGVVEGWRDDGREWTIWMLEEIGLIKEIGDGDYDPIV